MLAFIKGSTASEDNVEIPLNVPADFYDFLSK